MMLNSGGPNLTSQSTLTSPVDAIKAAFHTNLAQQAVGTAFLAHIGEEFGGVDTFLRAAGVEVKKTKSHLRRLESEGKIRNAETQLWKGTYFDQTIMLGRFSILETTINQTVNIPLAALNLAMYAFTQNTNPMMFDDFPTGGNFQDYTCMLQFRHAWYDTVIDINMTFLLEVCRRTLADQNAQLYNFVNRLNTSYINSDLYATIIEYIYDLSTTNFWNGFYIEKTAGGGMRMSSIYKNFEDLSMYSAMGYMEKQKAASELLAKIANIAREEGGEAFSIFSPKFFEQELRYDELIKTEQMQAAEGLMMAFEKMSMEMSNEKDALSNASIMKMYTYVLSFTLLKQIIGAAQSLRYKEMLRKTNVLQFGTNIYYNSQFDIAGLPAAMQNDVQLVQQIRNGLQGFLLNNTFDALYNNMVITMNNSSIGQPNYVMYTVETVDGSNATMTGAQISANTTLLEFTTDRFARNINNIKLRKRDISTGLDAREGVYLCVGPEMMLKGQGQFFDSYAASPTLKPDNAQFMIGGESSLYYQDLQFIEKFYNFAKKVRFFGLYGPFLISAADATTNTYWGNTATLQNNATNAGGFHHIYFFVMKDSIYNILANPAADVLANDAINNVNFSLNQHTTYYDSVNNRYTSVAEHVTTGTAQLQIQTNVNTLLLAVAGGKPSVFQAHIVDLTSYMLVEGEDGICVMPTKSIPMPANTRGNQEVMKIFVGNDGQLMPIKVSPYEIRIEGIIPDFNINDYMNITKQTGYLQ